MRSVGTLIFERPRPLSRQRRANHLYTLICEEPEIPPVGAVTNGFTAPREPLALALAQEQTVTEQVTQLARTARDEGDYIGEQFMQWFLKEQVEEVALMDTLLTVAERAGDNYFDLEEFVAREISVVESDPTAPPAAGGAL